MSCVLGHLAAAFLEWHALNLVIAYSVHRNLVALASATELHSEVVSDIHTNAGNLSSEQAISAEASPRSSDRQPGSTVRYLPSILLPEDRTESLDQSFKKVESSTSRQDGQGIDSLLRLFKQGFYIQVRLIFVSQLSLGGS